MVNNYHCFLICLIAGLLFLFYAALSLCHYSYSRVERGTFIFHLAVSLFLLQETSSELVLWCFLLFVCAVCSVNEYFASWILLVEGKFYSWSCRQRRATFVFKLKCQLVCMVPKKNIKECGGIVQKKLQWKYIKYSYWLTGLQLTRM